MSLVSVHNRTDFDQTVDATRRYEKFTRPGLGWSGSSRRAVSVHTEFLSETGKVESDDLQNNGLPGGETHIGTTACR